MTAFALVLDKADRDLAFLAQALYSPDQLRSFHQYSIVQLCTIINRAIEEFDGVSEVDPWGSGFFIAPDVFHPIKHTKQ